MQWSTKSQISTVSVSLDRYQVSVDHDIFRKLQLQLSKFNLQSCASLFTANGDFKKDRFSQDIGRIQLLWSPLIGSTSVRQVFQPISFKAGIRSSDLILTSIVVRKENWESEQITGLLRLCQSLPGENHLSRELLFLAQFLSLSWNLKFFLWVENWKFLIPISSGGIACTANCFSSN